MIGMTSNAMQILLKEFKDRKFLLENIKLDEKGVVIYTISLYADKDLEEEIFDVYIKYNQKDELFGEMKDVENVRVYR